MAYSTSMIGTKIFLPVVGHPNYLISNHGEVWSLHSNRFLKAAPSSSGYRGITACPGRIWLSVHVEVLRAFVGERPQKDWHALHLNGDQLDNRLDNLQWGSVLENMEDARRHGTLPQGESHGCAKLTVEKVRACRAAFAADPVKNNTAALSRAHGVAHRTMHRAVRGETWKGV